MIRILLEIIVLVFGSLRGPSFWIHSPDRSAKIDGVFLVTVWSLFLAAFTTWITGHLSDATYWGGTLAMKIIGGLALRTLRRIISN